MPSVTPSVYSVQINELVTPAEPLGVEVTMKYLYKCLRCSCTKETEHPINEVPEIHCEKCGEILVKVITGGLGFILKGGKWGSKDGY